MAIIFEDTFSGAGFLEDHVSDSGHHWVYVGPSGGSRAVLGGGGVTAVSPPDLRARYSVVETNFGALYGLLPPYTIQTIVDIVDHEAGIADAFAAGMGMFAPPTMPDYSLTISNRCELGVTSASAVLASAGSGDVFSGTPYTGGTTHAAIGENILTTIVAETAFQYVFNGVLLVSESHSGYVPLGGVGFMLAGSHILKSLKVWEGASLYPPGPPEPEPDPYDAGWWRRLSNATQTL